ncbi:hypothetical protein PAPYR_10963 [Paratrimastix pyriformis]|uniref:C2H2-type domain-containing protein n=1 Tax=Paratrimastix pyriformis TaxID=342808 RepID=A0ABQ8U4T7_9EUKA|nr:hypothetical protein PAPYR_10963 [Paratrimastix pyriformis]
MKFVCVQHTDPREFTLLKDYLRHWKTVHSAKPFQCGVPGCSRLFSFAKALVAHVVLAHPECWPYHCPIEGCHFRTDRESHLQRHVDTVHAKEDRRLASHYRFVGTNVYVSHKPVTKRLFPYVDFFTVATAGLETAGQQVHSLGFAPDRVRLCRSVNLPGYPTLAQVFYVAADNIGRLVDCDKGSLLESYPALQQRAPKRVLSRFVTEEQLQRQGRLSGLAQAAMAGGRPSEEATEDLVARMALEDRPPPPRPEVITCAHIEPLGLVALGLCNGKCEIYTEKAAPVATLTVPGEPCNVVAICHLPVPPRAVLSVKRHLIRQTPRMALGLSDLPAAAAILATDPLDPAGQPAPDEGPGPDQQSARRAAGQAEADVDVDELLPFITRDEKSDARLRQVFASFDPDEHRGAWSKHIGGLCLATARGELALWACLRTDQHSGGVLTERRFHFSGPVVFAARGPDPARPLPGDRATAPGPSPSLSPSPTAAGASRWAGTATMGEPAAAAGPSSLPSGALAGRLVLAGGAGLPAERRPPPPRPAPLSMLLRDGSVSELPSSPGPGGSPEVDPIAHIEFLDFASTEPRQPRIPAPPDLELEWAQAQASAESAKPQDPGQPGPDRDRPQGPASDPRIARNYGLVRKYVRRWRRTMAVRRKVRREAEARQHEADMRRLLGLSALPDRSPERRGRASFGDVFALLREKEESQTTERLAEAVRARDQEDLRLEQLPVGAGGAGGILVVRQSGGCSLFTALTGRLIGSCMGRTRGVTAAASFGHNFFLLGYEDGIIEGWPAPVRQVLLPTRTFYGHTAAVTSISVTCTRQHE